MKLNALLSEKMNLSQNLKVLNIEDLWEIVAKNYFVTIRKVLLHHS